MISLIFYCKFLLAIRIEIGVGKMSNVIAGQVNRNNLKIAPLRVENIKRMQ